MTVLTRDTRESFDGMARFYDRFTHHHDYEAWTSSLEGIAIDCGLSGHRLLDIGCGTGKSFLPFLARGYDVVACDLSPEMAARAAAKAPSVPVLTRDIRQLEALGDFELVCCLDDCLNHMHSVAELRQALVGIRRNLAPDGVAVFDLNTLATYRGFFADLIVLPHADEVLVWSGATPHDLGPGGIASAGFSAYVRDAEGGWDVVTLVHTQRHHPEAAVRAALAEVGLACAGVFGQGLDGIPHPGVDELSDTKAVYVARHAR
jgi:SAM-dependent methyltransferase